MSKAILSLLFLALGAANAQQLTPPPGGFTTGTPPIGVVVGPGAAPPLTLETALAVEQGLQAWLAQQRQAAPTAAGLRAARLSTENDAVERSHATPAGEIGPVHFGRLLPVTASKGVSDPALASVVRSTLRARLGRAPSAIEIDAELRAFDTRIGQINQALVTKRVEIAKAVKAGGAIPRTIEATALGVAPADPEVKSMQAGVGLRGLFQTLLSR